MLESKHSKYTKSQRAILDVLVDTNSDLSMKEIAEQTQFSVSTLRKNIHELVDNEDVVQTRSVGQSKMYQSKSKKQLLFNIRQSQHNGEGYLEDFILTTLEYSYYDVSVMDMAQISGFSRQAVLRKVKELDERGEIESTRTIDGNYLYTSA